MSNSMVRRWVRLFNKGRENVHDDSRSGRPSVVNKDLVRAVDEKIRENRRFTITSFSLPFPQISRSLLHEILCLVNLSFGNCVLAGSRSRYHVFCIAGGIVLR